MKLRIHAPSGDVIMTSLEGNVQSNLWRNSTSAEDSLAISSSFSCNFLMIVMVKFTLGST